jgi:hypothetical protein
VQPFPTKRPVIAPRTVVAYHGCSMATAEIILTDNRFLPSTNTYDWLGAGIYFWEYAPYRALEWARLKCTKSGDEAAVLGAKVRLGRCLNLLDTRHSAGLSYAYDLIAANLHKSVIPANTRTGAHYLDREIIDTYCMNVPFETNRPHQTVRGCYPEGTPVFPGSKLLSHTHVQIAVREAVCISDVHLVLFNTI